MSLAILFHFLCALHISDINISIIRSLRLFFWITTLVVLFLVRRVMEFRCGWVGMVSVLQASTCNTDTTPTQPHQNSITRWTKNNTINVVIQKNSRKLLMMDILMSETCRAHKKWNKIASDIKLVFYSSIIKFLSVYCQAELSKQFCPPYFLPAPCLNIFAVWRTVEHWLSCMLVRDKVVCVSDQGKLCSHQKCS